MKRSILKGWDVCSSPHSSDIF